MTSDRTETASPRPPSPWGDERGTVDAVLAWAVGRVSRASDPKTTARPAAELAAATGRTITPEGMGAKRALAVFDEVLVPATRAQDDPLNLAYIPAAPTRTAIAFELATSAANIHAGLWECGAGAIHAENQALAWIAELLGWPETAGGCFMSGGTSGNLSALAAARHDAQMRTGRPGGRWAVACSAGAHASIRAAAQVMDIEVVDVPVDEHGRMTGAALATALDAYAAGPGADDGVFAVVASAGTTNAGVVDDLAGTADVCEQRGLWLHVDGAYGGGALVAPSVRHLFAGIERADSFIVDPHKWLFAPYDCCALLYRRPELARAAHSQRAAYLDEVDRDEWNPSDFGLHLSRRPRGLPFWFSLAVHGTDAYRDAVEVSLATAREVAEAIRHRPFLRLVHEPELSVLLFERPGWTAEMYADWSRREAKAGTILCVPTRWKGESVLRLAFVNPLTDPVAVVGALDTLR